MRPLKDASLLRSKDESKQGWRRRWSGAVWLLPYGLFFFLLHELSAIWGVGSAYSLWFPAAGLRLAFLWHFGPRYTLAVAAAEVSVHAVQGRIGVSTDGLAFMASVVWPVLIYGMVVFLVRRLFTQEDSLLSRSAVQLALASFLAPLLAAPAAILWAVLLGRVSGAPDLSGATSMAAIFAVGDVLGILLVAPPLIWASDRAERRELLRNFRSERLLEGVIVLSAGWALTSMLLLSDGYLRLTPVLIAIVWISIRLGRLGAWPAVALSAAAALPLSLELKPEQMQLTAHMGLAAAAVAGHLVGSFADAAVLLQREIERRNRLLFQAERLKTLRAMSAAIIHEIGQPLATIAIEARHLASAAAAAEIDREDVAASAALVERKVAGLTRLVQRFRRFGERTSGDPVETDVTIMVEAAVELARLEAARSDVEIEVSVEPGLRIGGEPVELQQALLNLVRNAVQHSADRHVRIEAVRLDGIVVVNVTNRDGDHARDQPGMGIGLIVATSIVSAAGGTLLYNRANGITRYSLQFPEVGDG